MGIEPIGAGPGAIPGAAAPNSTAETAAFSVQQEELVAQQLQSAGGGGGHGGGHGAVRKATATIEEIAARASLCIERRKTPAERQAEIERLKKLAEDRALQAHERDDESDDAQQERRESDSDQDA
jgi:hypothetical protein